MSLTNGCVCERTGSLNEVASVAAEPDSGEMASSERTLDDAIRSRLSEALNTAAENTDPVAGLETALEEVAQELSRHADASSGSEDAAEPDAQIETAIVTLVNLALEADDPVAALDEGAESLADALVARDAAAEQSLQAALEQEIEFEGAYRHARLHRVTELIDVGYSLDQAVAITNANEVEIRARALASGRNPMELIHQYAVLNGYQGVRPSGPASAPRRVPPGVMTRGEQGDSRLSAMQALVALSDDAFAEATQGERWQKLMRR
jgi:hypothetical protein